MRRFGITLALAVAALTTGGCAVSLFSSEKEATVDEDRLQKLERRIDAVEKALPPR